LASLILRPPPQAFGVIELDLGPLEWPLVPRGVSERLVEMGFGHVRAPAMLTMLPPPRAAIVGASAPTRKYGARTLAANSRSKVASSRSAVGPSHENRRC
jgi:hypothetical protein